MTTATSLPSFDATPHPGTGPAIAAAVRQTLEPRLDDMVSMLRWFVEIESPSDDKTALDAMAQAIQTVFTPFGTITRHEPGGDALATHFQLDIPGPDANGYALVLCHYDTVWPMGTLATMPFVIDDQGIGRGPGCFDMKSGIALLYFALATLRDLGHSVRRPIRVLFTGDEEIGSITSRRLIEEAAQGAVVSYVLESPLANGTLKTSRKGTGDYVLSVEGRASHAGVEPQKGINAIHEVSYQVQALQALNKFDVGTTVSVGVIRGGSRPNVVPAHAEIDIDVRVSLLDEADSLDRAIRNLQPVLPGAKLSVRGGLNRPPMERSDAIGRLFERARAIAAGMGILDLQEGGTGGGSDGNFTAALGVPTLDGLGAEGDGAHAAHEQVLIPSLPRRAALLAGLLAEV